MIYRVCEGLSTLCAGLALTVGYRIAYATGVVATVLQLAVLSLLVEVRVGKEDFSQVVWQRILLCFRESFSFLVKARKALFLMFANSLVGAMDILLLFFLQAKLPRAGCPNWALGLALLFMQAGGVIGARVILFAKRAGYRTVFFVSSCVILLGIVLEHTGLYALMAAGGFLAALADDALQVRTNYILQNMFPSEQRATLISIESFTFSVLMIFLSPLAGLFFEWW